MALSTVFHISMYGLVALAGVMLALAEGAALPQGLTVPLAVLAFVFTERRKVLRLTPAWANGFGIVAFLAALVELGSGDLEARLLSGAHLVVYLSWIVLFQEKTVRLYWWMCALGVLQVAVGSVLTNYGLYGALLILYLFASIWTLSVFSLHQAREQFVASGTPTDGSRPAAASSGPLRRPSLTRGTIQLDPHERWISLRFVGGTFVTFLMAISIAAAFFLLIPRFWIGGQPLLGERLAAIEPSRAGFTEEVKLGDMGPILESTALALEIRLFDNETDQPMDVGTYSARLGYDEPLFRGSVMSQYEEGGWKVGQTVGQQNEMRSSAFERTATVRQEIRMQPHRTEVLFAIHPVLACRMAESGRMANQHYVSSVLYRPESRSGRGTRSYLAWSPAALPQPSRPERSGSGRRAEFVRMYLQQNRELPLRGLERLIVEARRIAGVDPDAQTGGEPPSQAEMARRLIHYLRDSGEFRYSLDARLHDRSIDPVEDFLFNRRQGHCEYYASALALMLRAVDIPSRLISGFKGGKVNRITGYHEVEQRHAHAWVEAWIDGRWVVLDATPAAPRNESIDSMGPRLAAWNEFTNFLREIWSQQVVNLEFAHQHQNIYSPLKAAAGEWWAAMSGGREKVSQWTAAVKEFVLSPQRWFSWQGGVATFVLLLVLSGLVWLVRRLAGLVRRLRSRYWQGRRAAFRVEFYERFQKLCAACGLVRAPCQTPREFAGDVYRRFNELLAVSGLEEFPLHLVEAFYRVRFGAESLEPEAADEIDRRLSQLEQCLTAPPQSPGRP